jgi:hypothetical protein
MAIGSVIAGSVIVAIRLARPKVFARSHTPDQLSVPDN